LSQKKQPGRQEQEPLLELQALELLVFEHFEHLL
jgi:hypothetical protein